MSIVHNLRLEKGNFSLKKAFKHLDGQYMSYAELRQEIRKAKIAWMAVLPAEYGPAEMYEELLRRGWVTFPLDGSSGMDSTVRFDITKTPSKQAKPRRKRAAK